MSWVCFTALVQPKSKECTIYCECFLRMQHNFLEKKNQLTKDQIGSQLAGC